MDTLQRNIWDLLTSMTGEDVARAFTNYRGNQILDEGFAEFLVDEGYCTAYDLGLEDEDEDEEDEDAVYYPYYRVIDADGDDNTFYCEENAREWVNKFGGVAYYVDEDGQRELK